MKVVGITGGIGSGKSTVCKIFNSLGVPVYEADTAGKWLMQHDEILKNNIVNAFGQEAYKGGKLDKTYLAQKVFASKQATERINELVHPVVKAHFEKWIDTKKKQGNQLVLKEAALIFETAGDKKLDAVITVFCPDSLRIPRILKRDNHRSQQDVENIIAKQWPQMKKAVLADYVIKNDQNELLIPQVLKIYNFILGLHSQPTANLLLNSDILHAQR